MHDIFGELGENPAYVDAFSGALASLWTRGVRSTLADYLSDKR
jgi:mannitol 2-dehydrogenase